jgi:membrane protease subunit HflC
VTKGRIIGGIVAAILLLIYSTVFIVDERKQALVLAFGKVDRVITEPGLHFKLPAPFNTKIIYEQRILPLETNEVTILPEDGKRRVAAAFARWRITDPQQFREAVADVDNALPRLEKVLSDSLGKVLGSESADAVLSNKREDILQRVTQLAKDESKSLGVEILDVRIRTWFLPAQTLEATYNRMVQDRKAVALGLRADGQEKARRIRAIAEKQAVELVAEARRDATTRMGLADAERNAIFADAYGRDIEFFSFQRSLSAYENSLQGGNSSIVMSPDSDFFEYLRDINGASNN